MDEAQEWLRDRMEGTGLGGGAMPSLCSAPLGLDREPGQEPALLLKLKGAAMNSGRWVRATQLNQEGFD